jgi:hypothetical protein
MLVEDLVLDTTSCAGPNEEEERYVSQSFSQNSSTTEPLFYEFFILVAQHFYYNYLYTNIWGSINFLYIKRDRCCIAVEMGVRYRRNGASGRPLDPAQLHAGTSIPGL